MNRLLAHLARMWRGTTADAERAAAHQFREVQHVETPTKMPCTRSPECPICRGLKSLKWSGGER